MVLKNVCLFFHYLADISDLEKIFTFSLRKIFKKASDA